MAGTDVTLSIKADVTGASRDIDSFAKKAQASVGSVTDAADTLKNGFTAIGGAFVASKIIDSLGTLINASSQAEDAFQRFTTSLRASGSYSDQAVRQFENLAAQIQKTSIFDDDAVLSQVALAKSFQTTNAEAEKLIKGAVELASATGESLETAVSTLGRTLDGTAGRLQEQIPALRALTEEQLRHGAALDIVIKKYQGFSESTAGTFSGSIKQAENAVHNLFEAFGDLVTKNDVVVGSIKKFTDIITAVTGDAGLRAVIAGIGGAVVAFGGLISILRASAAVYALATAAATAFNIASGGLVLVAAALASVGIGALIAKFASGAKTAKDNIADLQSQLVDARAEVDRFQKQVDSGVTFFYGDSPAKELDAAKLKVQGLEEEVRKLESVTNTSSSAIQEHVNRINFDELKQKLKAIQDEAKTLGSTPLEQVQIAIQQRIDTIFQAVNNGLLSEKAAFDLLTKYQLKNIEDVEAAQLKMIEKIKAAVVSGANNPIAALIATLNPSAAPNLGISIPRNADGTQNFTPLAQGAAGGAALSLLNGSQGATSLVSAGAGAVADIFAPGSGQVVSQITALLAQGPDKVKQMVDQFLDSLPKILVNIVKAIPAIITELIKDLPEFIGALIDAIPDIIDAFIDAIPDITAALAESAPAIIEKLVQETPRVIAALIADAPRFIGALIASAPNFIAKLLGGGDDFVQRILDGAGDFINKLIDGISGAFGGGDGGFFQTNNGDGGLGITVGNLKFASGGTVPAGFPNDSLPAQLSSGENVIDRSTNQKLNQFLDNGGGSGSQMLTINLQVGQSQLAKVMFDLSRQGFRTA